MRRHWTHTLLTAALAFTWLINGLFCKVLNLVPRHQQIVAKILGNQCATPFTLVIGFAEIAMCLWIISGIARKLCAITQILVIALMNIIEFILAPELLLFGRFNIVLASLLVSLIYIWAFILPRRKTQSTHE